MNTTPSSPDLESRAALREQDAVRSRVMFLRMADLSAEMAEIIVQRARDEAAAPVTTPTSLPELATAFDRVTRSLRRTALMIERYTAPPPPARLPAEPRPGPARRAAPAQDLDVSQMSDAELDAEIERLERLEGVEGLEDDYEAEFAGMSHEEIVLAILRDPDGTGRGAAPGALGAGAGITPARAGLPGGGAIRRDGAVGCRDP